jgi:hypothetical protein
LYCKGTSCTAVGIICIDNVEETSFTQFVISNVEEYCCLQRDSAQRDINYRRFGSICCLHLMYLEDEGRRLLRNTGG